MEPPALAGKKNGTRKSEPADELSFFFLFRPLRDFKYYLIGTKKNVTKNDRKLHEEILRQIAKYSHIWKKGKKAATKPADQANDSCGICKYFFDIEYGIGMENRSIFIPCFAGSR